MITHPAVISLLLSSVLISGMMLYASFFGLQVLRGWDLTSGSERQLALERKTYLISTLLTYVLAFQTASIFLFIYTADSLHLRFVGAMCAAGVLHVNGYGYSAFLLKIVSFLMAGVWLIINHVDRRAHDYPLIRSKYLLLLLITPFILTETLVQSLFFLGLKPDVITSCCGSLFGLGGSTLASEIAAIPPALAATLYAVGMTLSLGMGIFFYRTNRGGFLFSGTSFATFIAMALSLISFVSLYFYELPTHHCPFCILQREYGYVGYPLYLMLLAGAVCGLGVGALHPFRRVKSLATVLPATQQRLTAASILLYLMFTVAVLIRIYFSHLTLAGY
jgi:hypothetical protein